MAFMAMMGADSVAYHEANVSLRADDHPGQALAYYASRGETPLVWGGSGAAALGLSGRVTSAQFHALYGPGGAVDPATGERLVRTKRPGMELVIAAHKSVAELGVIGRAEHMHRILDAERDATLHYLDRLVIQQGGRRGDAAVSTRTGGLIYAVTRHATSRAGDPNPHDHVLIANLVRMADDKGGWKGAHTALVREHLHAATMFGRVAAAHEAVRLGYGIERDDGPSGKLGHWRIAGIPDEVIEVHSKRTAEIEAEMDRLGYSSFRAKGIVARNTRAHKRHEPVGDLMARWRSEIESVGWSVESLQRAVSEHRRRPLRPARTEERDVVSKVLAPDGPLAARKVFARRHVVVAVAPELFGADPGDLPRMVDRVLADPEALPLVATAGAWGRVWATATTVATEQAIAAAVERQVNRTDAPEVDDVAARRAMAEREAAMGKHLTLGQRSAVRAITTSGRGAELVVGVAGAGKTTALAAVREAFESEGFEVIGTSTSGQAARTLRNAAGIEESRTLASLTWRLDHGQLRLTDRHVVILDEAAMTEDAAMLRLLQAAGDAGAKVVMVGDHRQLGAVGPGGGFEALVSRYGPAVHVLDQNVRQRNVAERAALEQLRAGDVARAVAHYARSRCIRAAPDRAAALEATVAGWAADMAEGRNAAMYAWRRASVAELNRLARERWRSMGRLGKEELAASGGTTYAVGDRVVTLAPGAGGKVVTSETGTVIALDAERQSLTVRMDDGDAVRALRGEEIASERLAHGYAVTVHRSQGATVERTHALEDGGGRELAYVKMSRATDRSTVYVVADSVEQAVEDLRREWKSERRLTWAIDHAPSVGRPVATPSRDVDAALRRGRLLAERHAILAVVPADPAAAIRTAERELGGLRRRRADLETGRGHYANHPLNRAVLDHEQAHANVIRLEGDLNNRRPPRRERREKETQLVQWHARLIASARTVQDIRTPEVKRIARAETHITGRLAGLHDQQERRADWMASHPEAARRVDRIDRELQALAVVLERPAKETDLVRGPIRSRPSSHEVPVASRSLDIGVGL
jgi:conjugative relaxase-like TrwC/TraI family protein